MKANRILISLTLVFFLINSHAFAQKTGGVVFGANMNQFARNNDFIDFPSQNPTWGWHAGISVDPIHTKFYALRLELKYTNKGAEEEFTNGISTNLKSKVNLSYIQTNLFPIVIKPLGNKKLGPFVALGGYFSYLAKAKYNLSINTTPEASDDLAVKYTNKQDYGGAAALGIQFKKITLEYRIEAGIPNVLDQTASTSTIKNNTHGIIITFR